MRFLSVCSGIEAASVAWGPLGWKASGFAEIEPFPCAVLAHHYPDVPNHGDMTLLPGKIRAGEVEAPDLLCGGTPCQAFSVAGLRQSLDDARGNLTLTFCEIADAIDSKRKQPCIVFWENVPGVLNTKDNAFGCFLGALAGEDDALIAPGGRWANAGFVDGPQRAVAWRVLDAQYFGVAQRRRRVFVVASARADFDPAAVLFEFEGVRRDTAPSREAGQKVASTIAARFGVSRNNHEELAWDENGIQRTVGTLCADTHPGAYSGQDAYTGRLVPHTFSTPAIGHIVPDDVASTITKNTGAGGETQNPAYVAQPIALAENTIGRQPHNGGNGDGFTEGGPMYTLNATGVHGVAQPLAFQSVDRGADATENLSPTLRRHDPMAVAVFNISPGKGELKDDIHITEAHISKTLDASNSNPAMHQGGTMVMQSSMVVRRLTPVECERLQGFPDNYTNIPWRKQPESPDGPRYKALGNSWAVPVVRWIGDRIVRSLA